MDHFANPGNVWEIPDADAIDIVGNPICGNVMYIYIKAENDEIEDIESKTVGCGAVIEDFEKTKKPPDPDRT